MILKLDHSETRVSHKIRDIFQASYIVEAELIQAIDFPPLRRPLANFIACTNEFYGYLIDNKPVAVVEIDTNLDCIHIQSLVVLPAYFRQGIAGALLHFVFDTYGNGLYTVETGWKNGPATTLYENFGFISTNQWDTDHGVRKVSYEMRIKNSS